MGNIGDNINPTDAILSRLSQPRPANELPAELQCPAGHRARREIITVVCHVEGEPKVTTVEVPVWVCVACLVGYRYGECTLPAGEEGHA